MNSQEINNSNVMMTDQILYDYFTSTKYGSMENPISTTSTSYTSVNTSDSLENETKDINTTRRKKRIQTFSETSSDEEEISKKFNSDQNDDSKNSYHENGSMQIKPINRIVFNNDDDESEIISHETTEKNSSKRIHNKKKKLKEKFSNLKLAQEKCTVVKTHNGKINFVEDNSDEELDSCKKIKQMFKEKVTTKLSVICDPDSSEDEVYEVNNQKKAIMNSSKAGLPKPARITAKQAMENMQKIRSESNRMLREKEVSLPYHKPKALSLKDIMSRRKPALAPNGKALSVKMTAEQLEEYALHLEQRQKEMIELCKSDSDENIEEKDQDIKEIEQRVNDNQVENRVPEINTVVDIERNTHASEIHNTDILNNDFNENNKLVDSTSIRKDGEILIDNQNDGTVNTFNNNQDMESYSEERPVSEKEEKNSVDYTKSNGGDGSPSSANNKDDSQIMELHYDSEKTEYLNKGELNKYDLNKVSDINFDDKPGKKFNDDDDIDKLFLENDISFDEIGVLVKQFNENGDNDNRDKNSLNIRPKLIGAPGMFIDLDNSTVIDKKLTGIELLKDRFEYFSNLKSKEDNENIREKKHKPGLQHLKLKYELQNQIAEQRSLEWARRLEQETQQHLELKDIQGDESDTDDIEKIEAKLQKCEDSHISNDESEDTVEEEEICEDDCVIENKPRTKNPLVDDEAEESDIEDDFLEDEPNKIGKENHTENETDVDETDEDSSDNESSESEDEPNINPKKGRILKAFEDSDDDEKQTENKNDNNDNLEISLCDEHVENDVDINETQDEELQLAQVKKSPEDVELTQDQINFLDTDHTEKGIECTNKDLYRQTFSIKTSQNSLKFLDKLVHEGAGFNDNFKNQNLDIYCSQNFDSQDVSTLTESQELGADVAALCTGKFYDNPFVSQLENVSQLEDKDKCIEDCISNNEENVQNTTQASVRNEELILTSILEELDAPEIESPKQYKYFVSDSNYTNKENVKSVANNSVKKKFAIDSDDELDYENNVKNVKKKIKKRKLEKRALQFSDDEEDEKGDEEIETFESDIEEDTERLVEYDSEENEVEIQPLKVKKKRIAGDFLEQEAELTSEDEWIGSGDEDEAGLDRMEKEEGDDEVFHEGKLRNELGQIHMRDVLDQDKREVRLIQELLFEDGDLGDGHRQRKFRWRNADDIEDGGVVDEFGETQEEEFESEEQWRKQRHEREVFLRKMQGDNDEDINNCSINRSSIIKANLCSKNATSLILEDEAITTDNIQKKNTVNDGKNNKDIPSPKKPFPILQRNHHGSFLSRGKNALARLAAIATPIVGDGNSTTKVSAPTNSRNFVFAAVSQDNDDTKVSKRKADTAAPSAVLTKKMKTEEKPKYLKSSLFDYLET